MIYTGDAITAGETESREVQIDVSEAGAARERSGPRKDEGLTCAAGCTSDWKLTEPKKIVSSSVTVAETPAEGEMVAETPEEMLAETPKTEGVVLVAQELTSNEPKEVPRKH